MQMGHKIAERRNALGITQVELAETMHVTRQTVSRWENNTVLPDIEKIAELAAILGVSCDYLLTDADENGLLSESAAATIQKSAANREPSRLLMNLIGKRVQFEFYEGEEDWNIAGECTVLGFDGTWFKVRSVGKNADTETLVAAASVLSIDILEKGAAS